jgi:hypothetical protein
LKSLDNQLSAIDYLKSFFSFKSDMQLLLELCDQLSKLSFKARSDYYTMCATVTADILNKARVVLCTVATASSTGRESLSMSAELKPLFAKLTTIIIDEAGTAPESKLPLLLTLNPTGNITRIIAIGDQKQLPPFNLSQGDQMGFFQRLDKALPGMIGTLTEQYRMHPVVCGFISNAFYDGKLKTSNAVSAARIDSDPIGLYWLTYDNSNAESTAPNSFSKQNEIEARLAVAAVQREVRNGRSIMVITFYKSQENLIRELFKKNGLEESSECRLTTVDQSQGSESDVIILSGVRCNKKKQIGFVNKPNRINVSASRMKKRLIVIGSVERLTSDKNWRELYKLCKEVPNVNDIPPLDLGNTAIDGLTTAIAQLTLEVATGITAIDGLTRSMAQMTLEVAIENNLEICMNDDDSIENIGIGRRGVGRGGGEDTIVQERGSRVMLSEQVAENDVGLDVNNYEQVAENNLGIDVNNYDLKKNARRGRRSKGGGRGMDTIVKESRQDRKIRYQEKNKGCGSTIRTRTFQENMIPGQGGGRGRGGGNDEVGVVTGEIVEGRRGGTVEGAGEGGRSDIAEVEKYVFGANEGWGEIIALQDGR